MQLHTTKGIVLRTVKYGDTSIIASVYTELFGVQSYLIKGVRKSSKKSQGSGGYFQSAAILDMVVYHNEQKQIQFVKEFNWGYLYESVLFDVVKNSVALYVIELLQHSLKQPEANPELFYLIEGTLRQLDRANDTLTANLPLYFTLHLGAELGFKIQGVYSTATPVLDLQEGLFTGSVPVHPYYIAGDLAQQTSLIGNIHFYSDLENIKLNRDIRRQLLQAYQQYIVLHVTDFGEMRSVAILQEVLG